MVLSQTTASCCESTVGQTPQPESASRTSYQHRVHVPNILFLRIDNLTLEDSGQYRARASFTRGIELNQVFLLTVYGKRHLLTMASLLLLS